MHNVLILGSGRVSRPAVRHLGGLRGVHLVVGSLIPDQARAQLGGSLAAEVRRVDVNDPSTLEPLVREADVAISFVPPSLHVQVARAALRHRTHLVTTSYLSEEMQELDGEARRAGVTLLNECGLDPGLDHASAQRLVDRERARGGRVVAFASAAGSLPAPEASATPWRYKFSWSPRGALLAARESARYLAQGAEVFVPAERMLEHRKACRIPGLGEFETYPNRDSIPYVELYGIAGVREMRRSTIRYPGWCETIHALDTLDLLDPVPQRWERQATYAGMVARALPASAEPLRLRVARRLAMPESHEVLQRLEWSGLFAATPLPREEASPLDQLVDLLQQRLVFAPGERDMVVMQHEIVVQGRDGKLERVESRLTLFGEPNGDSATARTVSLPAALVAMLILEGRIEDCGVRIPTDRSIYEPLLNELEEFGIGFEEARAAC